MDNSQLSLDTLLFSVVVSILVYILMSLIWDFFSIRSYRRKTFESIKTDLIFNTIAEHLEVEDYWFIDDQTTQVKLAALRIDVEYHKFKEPNQVIETASISGEVEFNKKFFKIEPFLITYSISQQSLLDNDSQEVISIVDAKNGMNEQIMFIISKNVNEGDFGLKFDVDLF